VRRTRPALGRPLWHGLALEPTRLLPEGQSLLVVGSTQSGKTSSLVIPALLRWEGSLVVLSVKDDVRVASEKWRRTCGEVQVVAPAEAEGLTWNPLEGISSLRDALVAARDLCRGVGTPGTTESEFWNTLAAKLLGALFLHAQQSGASIFDVVRWLDSRDFDSWYDASSEVSEALASWARHDERTRDSIITTAEAVVAPWLIRQPLARLQLTPGGTDSVYLVAPRHDHQRYASLFRGALRCVLESQEAQWASGEGSELLLVIDEAATVAALDDLDQLAATGIGLGVTLVTVVQDFSQMRARWGEAAASLVNNHATRVIYGGMLDAAVATFVPEVEVLTARRPLRTWPRGRAILISGRRAPRVIRLRPWWTSRHYRHRAAGEEQTTLRP